MLDDRGEPVDRPPQSRACRRRRASTRERTGADARRPSVAPSAVQSRRRRTKPPRPPPIRAAAGGGARAGATAASASRRRAASAMVARSPAKHRRMRAMAARRIEIDAGRAGDADLAQHAAAEIAAVVGEMRDVGIEIERAVGRREALEPGLGQFARAAARGSRHSARRWRRARRWHDRRPRSRRAATATAAR